MRALTLALLIAAIASKDLTQAQESQSAKTNKASFHLEVATEDTRQTKVTVEIRTGERTPNVVKRIDDMLPGSAEVVLSGFADGDYWVFFSAPGYAAQWQPLTVKQGKGAPGTLKAKLFRTRYVVLRYVFNTSGGRELSGKNIEEGRVAVAHWGSLPHFGQDWQIWQRSSGDGMFGDTPYMDFHRFSTGFGFAKVPTGVAFDDLKAVPEQLEYACRTTKAEKGLTLFCRVEAGRKDGLGYGKVVVEEVTETPPAGINVIESP